MWRIGRLIGIVVKAPFSSSSSAGPPPESQTGALRSWELSEDTLAEPHPELWQYRLLEGLITRTNLCGKRIDVDKAVSEAVKAGGGPDLGNLSPETIVVLASTTLVPKIVDAVDWLEPTMEPTVTGFVVLVSLLGLRRFCRGELPEPATNKVET